MQAAARLSKSNHIARSDKERLEEIIRWFSVNLETPSRFTRTRNASHKRTRGIAWFKDTAAEHLRRARAAARILEEHGIAVDTIETERPGYTVYEDEFQLIAEPFAETGA